MIINQLSHRTLTSLCQRSLFAHNRSFLPHNRNLLPQNHQPQHAFFMLNPTTCYPLYYSTDNTQKTVITKNNLPPSPTSTSPQQQQEDTKKNEPQLQVSSSESSFDMSKWMAKGREASAFYYNGTKTMFHNFYTAYQLRKQINNRIFRKATRREIMFLNCAFVDFCKFVPFFALFCIPFSTLLIPVIGHFVPAFLPSGYQRPKFLDERRKRHTNRRREMSQTLNQEFMRLASGILNRRDMIDCHLEASLIQAIILKVREEQARGDDYVQVSCKVLSDLVQFERAETMNNGGGLFQSEFTLERLSDEVIKNMSLFSLASRSEYGGVSGGTSTKYGRNVTLGLFSLSMSTAAQTKLLGFVPVPRKMRMKALRKYMQMIRADDELIADFSVYNLKTKELQQALYVRGFNVYGEHKLTVNELQELLKAWIQFSRSVRTETLFLLAPAVLWWN